MSSEELLALIAVGGVVGAFLNPIISFLKGALGLETGEQTVTKQRLKFALAFVTSIGGGILTAVVAGQFIFDTLLNILTSTGVVFAAATIVYNLYWQNSTPEGRIEASGKSIF